MRNRLVLARFVMTAVLTMTVTAGCSASRTDDQGLTVARGALTVGDILGFEDPAAWNTGTIAKGSSDLHVQGQHSLAVEARGWTPIVSVALARPVEVGATVSYDLRLPITQANPWWFGATQIYFNCPSCNIFNAFVGQVELTGFPLDSFHTVSIPVAQSLRSAVRPTASDFTVTIVINVPTNATGAYLLDNLRLGATATGPTCAGHSDGTACDDSDVCTRNDACKSGVCGGDRIPSCQLDAKTGVTTVDWHRVPEVVAKAPACGDSPSSVELPGATPFKIPSTIAVSGPSGAVSLNLTVGRDGLAPATCRYAAPKAPAGTRNASFVSCSDGGVAGTLVEATSYALAFTAADGVPLTSATCGGSRFTARMSTGADALPVLDEPLSAAETTALRQGFSWASTQAVGELDAQGRPLLYYGLVFIENNAQIGFLDDLEIHHDFLPILEGLGRWRGQVGLFTHHGDGQGVFTFVLMTGQQYNLVRQAALAGNVPFSVIRFRTPPAGFANSDNNTVSYDALSRIRFRYRGIDPVFAASQPPSAPILCAIDVGGGVKGAVQAAAGLAHGTANFVAHLIGLGAGVLTGTNRVSVIATSLNADPTFNTFLGPGIPTGREPTANYRATTMVQAWGADAGLALPLTGAKVRARGVTVPSFSEATLDSGSRADGLVFNVGIDTSVCLLMQNNAVDMIDFITSVELCDISGYNVATPSLAVVLAPKILSDFTNVMAQMIDASHFSETVVGLVPARVSTLVGHYADFVPNPVTPCFTLPTLLSLGAQPITALVAVLASIAHPVDAAKLITLGSCIYDVDMIIPSQQGFARSRAAASHEYGHWMMCNLLEASGPLDLTAAYTPAIFETLAPPVEVVGECNARCGNEGFADVIAAQVTGGVDQSLPPHAVGALDVSSGEGTIMLYCPADSGDCLENNIGGPGQDLSNIVRFDPDGQVRNTNTTRFTSVFHDFLDSVLYAEPLNAPSNANFWNTSMFPFTLESFLHRGDRNDEAIRMPGTGIRDAILHREGISIDQDAIFRGLVTQARTAGYNWCEICQLFAIHDPRLSSESAPASERFALCQQQPITRWLGAPPVGVDNNCVPLPVVCPAGQIVSTEGTCIVPPCAGGLVLNFDGTCAAACDPQFAQGVEVDVVRNGRCVIVVP